MDRCALGRLLGFDADCYGVFGVVCVQLGTRQLGIGKALKKADRRQHVAVRVHAHEFAGENFVAQSLCRMARQRPVPTVVPFLIANHESKTRTVNIAARVQGLAGPQSIYATDAVIEHRLAQEVLARSQIAPVSRRASLKGIRDEVLIYEILPAK